MLKAPVFPRWRIVWRCLKTLNTELPCDPATPLLGMHLEKVMIQNDTRISVHTAASQCVQQPGPGHDLNAHQQIHA